METASSKDKVAIKRRKRGVSFFIAYTSVVNARESQLVLAHDHAKTEEAIVASGILMCFLRNNWYVENEKDTILAYREWRTIFKSNW
ncbi:hypothetical protein ACEQPO_14665 [Bacillus sp. SL00103]